jgi:hypothetical protein
MYFGASVRLYDTLAALQGIQQLAAVLALLSVGYLFIKKKRFTPGIKLWLWALAITWVIAGTALYAYGLHNYLRYSRPVFRKENFSQTGL